MMQKRSSDRRYTKKQHINAGNRDEFQFFKKKFGVSGQALAGAIRATGSTRTEVISNYLRQKKNDKAKSSSKRAQPSRSIRKANTIREIKRIASASKIARYRWKNRGVAKLGYTKGMALVYARVYCKFKSGDSSAKFMAQAKTSNRAKDALTWYDARFRAVGMTNNTAGADTLRHLFVLLIGLGMRESSGRYCEGRDRSATNTTSETAEAGLFQTSYNARTASKWMSRLFKDYSQDPSDFVEVFREGVRCSRRDLENFGSGRGHDFQKLSKECPAFAAEFAAVGLRRLRKHWGPIRRREAEVMVQCDEMLLEVQNFIDSSNSDCSAVL